MGSKIKLVIVSLIFFSVLIFLPHSHGRSLPHRCRIMPLRTTEGRTIRIEDFYGKPLIIVFFESTCLACQKELKLLRQLKKVSVLAISMDKNPQFLKEFLKREKLPFPVVLYSSMVGKCFGKITQVPTLFFLSSELFITGSSDSPLEKDEISRTVEKTPSCHCNF